MKRLLFSILFFGILDIFGTSLIQKLFRKTKNATSQSRNSRSRNVNQTRNLNQNLRDSSYEDSTDYRELMEAGGNEAYNRSLKEKRNQVSSGADHYGSQDSSISMFSVADAEQYENSIKSLRYSSSKEDDYHRNLIEGAENHAYNQLNKTKKRENRNQEYTEDHYGLQDPSSVSSTQGNNRNSSDYREQREQRFQREQRLQQEQEQSDRSSTHNASGELTEGSGVPDMW